MPRGTQDPSWSFAISPTGFLPSVMDFPKSFGYGSIPSWRSFNPNTEVLVWAFPFSLAATGGIEFSLFSSGYLDVSVPQVAFLQLWIGCRITGYYSSGVFPFGYLRVVACLQLVVAFRSLPRPSSALSAKASTERPY